jgi:HEAT repeat protein
VAAWALIQIGPAALPEVRAALQHADPQVRMSASWLVSKLAEEHERGGRSEP